MTSNVSAKRDVLPINIITIWNMLIFWKLQKNPKENAGNSTYYTI